MNESSLKQAIEEVMNSQLNCLRIVDVEIDGMPDADPPFYLARVFFSCATCKAIKTNLDGRGDIWRGAKAAVERVGESEANLITATVACADHGVNCVWSLQTIDTQVSI